MKISVGNPVEGEDFFDREKEQARAWRKLEGSHLLMLAPRRIGKTSLILRLCATASEHGFQAVHCSFARCESEQDCVRLLCDTVAEQEAQWKKLTGHLKAPIERIKGVKIGPVGIDWDKTQNLDWRAAGDILGKALEELDKPWLVCVDELPVFILNLLKQGDDGKRRAKAFLYWLRDLRQRHYRQVKWLLAGSIGLDTITSRLGISDTINDLEPFPLSAFDESVASDFLAKLSESYQIPLAEPIRQAIVRRVGWPLPYYLQLMFSQLREEWDENGVELDEPAVERAFERLLQPAYRVHFDYWRQRLDEELGQPDASYAAVLLDHASRDPAGLSRSSMGQMLREQIHEDGQRDRTLNYLLDVLANDGYLVEREERYAFRLEWLRVYWQRRLAR